MPVLPKGDAAADKAGISARRTLICFIETHSRLIGDAMHVNGLSAGVFVPPFGFMFQENLL